MILALLSINSRHVVRIIPWSVRYFLRAGSCMANKSPLRVLPDSEIYRKISEGAVQCMMTMVTPGCNSAKDSIYFFVLKSWSAWSFIFFPFGNSQP